MIDVRTAIQNATKYFQAIGDMVGEGLKDLRLEEVELSEDSKTWFVTLGYGRPVYSSATENMGLYDTYQREYKQFKIDALTGEVRGMLSRRFSHGKEEYWIPLT